MKILFVCQGNINRSQMAGAIMGSLRPDIEVKTAGVAAENAGKRVSDVSTKGVNAMKEIGLDTSANPINQLTPEMVEWADTVVLMGELPESVAPDYLSDSPKLQTWDVPDPGYAHISHEAARDQIYKLVKDLADSI